MPTPPLKGFPLLLYAGNPPLFPANYPVAGDIAKSVSFSPLALLVLALL